MRLLIAEDDRAAGAYLAKGLVEAGFVVDWVCDGDDALHLASERDYDLVVLDVGLPGLDGWQVLQRLRARGPAPPNDMAEPVPSVPVLFVTARDMVEDRVRGLELGADDYLVKPYAFSELLARVRALLRRGKGTESEVLRLADLAVHRLRRRVTRAGTSIHLSAKEYLLLELFLRRQGEVLPRTLIAEQVWDMNFDSDTNVVEVAIRRLRAKIDEPFAPKLLHTVRGFGYVMEIRA